MHFVLLTINDLVNVLFVGLNKIFFLVENFTDQVVMVLVHLVEVVPVLNFHVLRRRNGRELIEVFEKHHGRDPGSLLSLKVLIELQ